MTVARLIKGGARAASTTPGKAATTRMPNNSRTHSRLLTDLGYALKSFFDELKESRLADRVVVLCFSEFGRRVQENASSGTDHGTAGPCSWPVRSAAGAARRLPQPHRLGRRRSQDDTRFPPSVRERTGELAQAAVIQGAERLVSGAAVVSRVRRHFLEAICGPDQQLPAMRSVRSRGLVGYKTSIG